MIPFKRLLWACEYFIWWYCHSQISDFGVIKWKRFPPSNLYWLPIQEMASLSVNTRKEMLNSTYPALYVVMFSILEGNTRYKNTNTQPNTNNKEVFILQSDWTSIITGSPVGLTSTRRRSISQRRIIVLFKDISRASKMWVNHYLQCTRCLKLDVKVHKIQEYPPLRRRPILYWISSNWVCKKTWKAKLKILYRFERFPWKIKRGSHPLGQWR